MSQFPWWLYALASAACAAVIPILGKVGLRGVNAELATVLRGVAAALALLVIGTALGVWSSLASLREGGARALAFVAMTGVAGALSWIFYFKALALGEASRVAPLDKLSVPLAIVLAFVVLGERPSALNWLGIALAVVGIALATLPSR